MKERSFDQNTSATHALDPAVVVAVYNACRGTRKAIGRLQAFSLSVDQAFVLAEVGVAAKEGEDAVHHTVKELLQKRDSTVGTLFYQGLLTGGKTIGERSRRRDT